MNRRCINASLFKLLCYLRGSKASHAQSENISDHFGGFLIYNPVQLIFRVFNITVRRIGAEWLTGLSLGFEHSTDFLASILSVPFIEHTLLRKGERKQAKVQYSCGFAARWLSEVHALKVR
jgi:hypothetical protein